MRPKKQLNRKSNAWPNAGSFPEGEMKQKQP